MSTRRLGRRAMWSNRSMGRTEKIRKIWEEGDVDEGDEDKNSTEKIALKK